MLLLPPIHPHPKPIGGRASVEGVLAHCYVLRVTQNSGQEDWTKPKRSGFDKYNQEEEEEEEACNPPNGPPIQQQHHLLSKGKSRSRSVAIFLKATPDFHGNSDFFSRERWQRTSFVCVYYPPHSLAVLLLLGPIILTAFHCAALSGGGGGGNFQVGVFYIVLIDVVGALKERGTLRRGNKERFGGLYSNLGLLLLLLSPSLIIA